MKIGIKELAAIMVATLMGAAWADPTMQELTAAEAAVQECMKSEKDSLARGKVTRTQVADAALRKAPKAASDAERALLYKGAFLFYVKDGAFAKAFEARRLWRGVMTGMSDAEFNAAAESAGQSLKLSDSRQLRHLLSRQWTFRTLDPNGGYWNSEISDSAVTLRVHEKGGRIFVQPLSQVPGFVDLTKKVRSANGSEYTIVGIGAHLHEHITWAWDPNLRMGALTGVALPPTLRYIYAYSFEKCARLERIELPEGVETTCRRSFYGCVKLREIKLPRTLHKICGEAFCGCAALESLEVPASVQEIGSRAFAECSNLKSVRLLGDSAKVEEDAFADSPCASSIVKAKKTLDRKTAATGSKTGNGAAVPTNWLAGPSDEWFVRWEPAVEAAKKQGKKLFVLMTGSDWCPWCVRLHDNVLSKPEFLAFARKNLVLVYFDSPSKKPMPEEQKKYNAGILKKIGLGGGYPTAAVVDPATEKSVGKVGGGGYPVDKYIEKLEELLKKEM